MLTAPQQNAVRRLAQLQAVWRARQDIAFKAGRTAEVGACNDRLGRITVIFERVARIPWWLGGWRMLAAGGLSREA